jgi:hypothetical protein
VGAALRYRRQRPHGGEHIHQQQLTHAEHG